MDSTYVIIFLITFIGALVPILFITSMLSTKDEFPVDGKTIIVTGGSQGMGRGVAKLLASKGASVVIVARDQKKLDAALEYIKNAAKRSTQRFLALSIDLTSAEANTRLIALVTAWNNNAPPDIVWAVAGSSVPKLFLDADVETLQSQMAINYWAGCFLAHATLKAWYGPYIEANADHSGKEMTTGSEGKKKKHARHFILTSSVAAMVGVAGYATYAPAKAALRSLSDNLTSEVNLYHGAFSRSADPPPEVKIHTVLPGTIDSPGLVLENKSKHPVTFLLEKDDPIQTEDQVAAAAYKGLRRGDNLIMTNWLGHVIRWGNMSGSPRNGCGIIDTIMAPVTNFAWLIIGPDMMKTAYKWGKKNGLYGKDEKKS